MSPESDVIELRIAGEVDLRTVAPMRASAERAASSGDYRVMVFDLEEVTFMDSSGLHLLAESSRLMAASGGVVEVRCSSPHLLKLLSLTGLDRLLTIISRPTTAAITASA